VRYLLPKVNDDFVILTPLDILTRDETWISHSDMIQGFDNLPIAVEDDVLRAQINLYFSSQIGDNPTKQEQAEAASKTINKYPILIDHYIREKENEGDRAKAASTEKTEDLKSALIVQVQRAIPDIKNKSDFYSKPWRSYDEVRERVATFKHYVEHEDGWRVINRSGAPFSRESEVQLFFGLIWCNSDFDVNREPNNGRGPVDFKVSYGSKDKSLIEFKLAKSTSLKRNMEKQVAIYEEANGTRQSMKVIICYTAEDQDRARDILFELDLLQEESIVLIDARSDNKPSASTA